MQLTSRATPKSVALETTLLAHGVPKAEGRSLAQELEAIVREEGAEPATVGVLAGSPIVGMNADELAALLDEPDVPKANTANLGVLMHAGRSAATTVSATMELAAAAGVRVFATGGLGGVHRGFGTQLDISSDLAALARFPVAVVASGVKSVLDVLATREALEALGVPAVGFGTDEFPAFYQRSSGASVDARFDSAEGLAAFASAELSRTGRGLVVAHPVPETDEIGPDRFAAWLADAEEEAARAGATGRAVTPAVLAALHRVSGGATLRTNLALVRSNARLAGRLAAAMPGAE